MKNKRQEAPSIVGDNDVEGTSQKDESQFNHNESLFQPETLAEFIKSVTDENGKVDLLLAHNMRMPLIVTIALDNGLTHNKQLKDLYKLEQKINSWLLAKALKKLRQVNEDQECGQSFRKIWGKSIAMICEIEDLLLFLMFTADQLSPEQQRVVDAVQAAISNWREA